MNLGIVSMYNVLSLIAACAPYDNQYKRNVCPCCIIARMFRGFTPQYYSPLSAYFPGKTSLFAFVQFIAALLPVLCSII